MTPVQEMLVERDAWEEAVHVLQAMDWEYVQGDLPESCKGMGRHARMLCTLVEALLASGEA